MRLNGWQRLFCVFSALILSAALGIWILQRPSESQYALGCDHPFYVDSEEAKGFLARLDYRERADATEPKCADRLKEIATGAALREERQKWAADFWMWTPWLVGFLAFVYALGAALGWIWRGFFPVKAKL